MPVRKIVTALTISAFFMVWIALGWQLHHAVYGTNATALGYSGPVVEVVALHDPTSGSADDPVGDIASLFDLSLAYERQLNSGVLTITDPTQRFSTENGPLVPHDLAHNKEASWVGVNETIPIPAHDVAVSISPDFHGTVLDPVPSGLSLSVHGKPPTYLKIFSPILTAGITSLVSMLQTLTGLITLWAEWKRKGSALLL